MKAGRALAGLGVLVLAGGAVGAYVLTTRDDTSVSADEAAAPTTTTKVQKRDVVTYDDTTATLTYRTSVTVSSPVSGTVTTILAEGDTIDAGTVVATIDGAPVVALFGDVPGWRQLSTSSAAGIDVRQLEENLVALGFDPDGKITIDETFDKYTKAAVIAWEDSLGLEGDGVVPASQIVYLPGRLLVDSISASIGSAATTGAALLTGRETERRFLVATPGASTISGFAAGGTPVGTGTTLFRNDGLPVAAIEGDASAVPALARDLSVGVDDGADVRLLERMLAAGGFDPDGAMTVDDTFDAATAAAVLRWWQSVDPTITTDPATLVVPRGSYVVVPANLVVGTPLVADGTALTGDAVVLPLTAPARVVTTSAPINDDTFKLGATILVEFPDGSTENGTVVKVGNVATNPNQQGGAGQTPNVAIDIQVDAIPASVETFVSVPVTLRVVADKVDGALVVPVSALVALAEGGYALEIVDGAAADGSPATRLVAAKTGLFADGFVVVEGAEIKEGLQVVVPS